MTVRPRGTCWRRTTGIGKSRLLDGFRERAKHQGAVVFTGAWELGGEGSPSAPITEAFRGLTDEVAPVEPWRPTGGGRPGLARPCSCSAPSRRSTCWACIPR